MRRWMAPACVPLVALSCVVACGCSCRLRQPPARRPVTTADRGARRRRRPARRRCSCHAERSRADRQRPDRHRRLRRRHTGPRPCTRGSSPADVADGAGRGDRRRCGRRTDDCDERDRRVTWAATGVPAGCGSASSYPSPRRSGPAAPAGSAATCRRSRSIEADGRASSAAAQPAGALEAADSPLLLLCYRMKIDRVRKVDRHDAGGAVREGAQRRVRRGVDGARRAATRAGPTDYVPSSTTAAGG